MATGLHTSTELLLPVIWCLSLFVFHWGRPRVAVVVADLVLDCPCMLLLNSENVACMDSALFSYRPLISSHGVGLSAYTGSFASLYW